MKPLVRILVALLLWPCAAVRVAAQEQMPGVVLEVQYTPAPRAQIAIWIEREDGTFLRTLSLTEAVAYRGIGNRPGASQMNSGYRWPYGRREGALPIWASRRASAPHAQPFKRVIFQNRASEGLASRTSSDQSVDRHFCLSFNQATTKRDALDAVSCASVFTSDKGRFITDSDLVAGYSEPYEEPGSVGVRMPLSLHSLYPPRMDVTRCTASGCFDHADVATFAAHARAVMPEIDAVTTATPPGGELQSDLFSLPADFPRGHYVLWLEINVEGDYNDTFNDATYPTPTEPASAWDSWAIDYGYAYRGQPSIAFSIPFELDQENDVSYTANDPVGRSSWDVWSADYGALEQMAGVSNDPVAAPASGADRLLRSADGTRLTVHVRTLSDRPEPGPDPVEPDPTPPDPNPKPDPEPDPSNKPAGVIGSPDAGSAEPDPAGGPAPMEQDEGVAPEPATEPKDEGNGVILREPTEPATRAVGTIRELRLTRHPDEIHSHEWIGIRFLAAESVEPLHSYEVRVSSEPIVDERTFLMRGRPAKNATESDEGAVSLMLPADIPPGGEVEGEIGDLSAETRYYVAVRAVDRLDRRGPISVARITTTRRTFTTVTPCFVASAAYGTPLAREVGVLRRVRDRYLMSHEPGRRLVAAYYAHGEALARFLREHPVARRAVHDALEPLVAALSLLVDAPE